MLDDGKLNKELGSIIFNYNKNKVKLSLMVDESKEYNHLRCALRISKQVFCFLIVYQCSLILIKK
jgi:hypothetical protein